MPKFGIGSRQIINISLLLIFSWEPALWTPVSGDLGDEGVKKSIDILTYKH